MTEYVKILVVEDTDDMFDLYADQALDSSTDDLRISLVRAKTVAEGRTSLLSNEYDGAIVDLNLSQDNPLEASGNDILLEILEKHRFPVFVVSGNLTNLKHEIRTKESAFLKFFDRSVSNKDIFDGFIKIYDTGITKILGGRGLIEKQLSEIFWAHLSGDLICNIAHQSEKILLRHIVSHLLEYLDIPDEEVGYHESEFYIKPPIREHIATGDLVKLNGENFIVLSPACDIAVRNPGAEPPQINAERILLAPAISVNYQSFVKNGIIKAESKLGDRSGVLSEIIKGKRERYGFLPKYGSISPSAVDFQNIITMPFAEFIKLERIATISGVFMKDIQSRFAAYLGRQGQPDLDKKRLATEYKGLLDAETKS